MSIVEQTFRITERTTIIKTDHPAQHLFQLFVNGRLQDKGTYSITGSTIDFGFDCLVAGDLVQVFFFLP
jgi:hypothetical protein